MSECLGIIRYSGIWNMDWYRFYQSDRVDIPPKPLKGMGVFPDRAGWDEVHFFFMKDLTDNGWLRVNSKVDFLYKIPGRFSRYSSDSAYVSDISYYEGSDLLSGNASTGPAPMFRWEADYLRRKLAPTRAVVTRLGMDPEVEDMHQVRNRLNDLISSIYLIEVVKLVKDARFHPARPLRGSGASQITIQELTSKYNNGFYRPLAPNRSGG